MFGLAPLLLIFPLLGFFFNALVGRKFVEHDRKNGEKWTGWVSAGVALASFAVTLLLLFHVKGHPEGAIITLFDWFNIPAADFYIPWAMQIDTLSVTMLCIVTGVGSLIHIYAMGYMHGDENYSRFFAYLSLFMFFMIMLVTGSSYLTLFVGWEGVGLASFLLIGFWFSKDNKVLDKDRNEVMYEGFVNSNAARKAFVVNRVGDLCMIVAMSLIFWTFGTMEYQGVFDSAIRIAEGNAGHLSEVLVPGLEHFGISFAQMITLICILLLLGATGKSAQFPMFVWLPDAMAGPTPVSALMHAATMVTSGIYLLVRSNVLLEIARESHHYVAFNWTAPDIVAGVGAFTALYAGLIAFTQFDIKKVLAYSTVSQLGFMIAAVGMGAYVAAIFHLATHAFFKALLFMGAGSVIHGMEHGHHHLHDHHHGHDDHHHDDDGFDPQDMRFMGGLIGPMNTTAIVYIIGALALAGIFPFAGFWSKDEILAHATVNGFPVISWTLTLAAICTAFYMGRQLKMVFFGKPRHAAAEHAHESPQIMTRPLIILAALSVMGGMALNLPNFPWEAMDSHGEHAEAHGDEHGDAHGDDGHGDSHADDSHGDSHAAMTTAAIGSNPCDGSHGGGHGDVKLTGRLVLEHWLEHSVTSFCLTDAKVVHMPHTPIILSIPVAVQSTLLAVLALAGSFFFVYRNKPESSDDKDPIFTIPVVSTVFNIMKELPINSLYMGGIIPAFNAFADFCGHVVDWLFYHDFVHEGLIRGTFLRIAKFTNNVLDRHVVDGGLVLGTGRLIRGISGAFKQVQSGLVRNYALTLLVGVVALLLYFIVL